MTTAPETSRNVPLYLDEAALHARLAPHLSRAAFVRAVTAMEAYGFPKPHPLFKGRYLPQVRAWLDAQEGLQEGLAPRRALAPDGEETWDAIENAGPAKTGAKGCGAGPLLGCGEPVEAGRGPLSRSIDRFTARRHRAGN